MKADQNIQKIFLDIDSLPFTQDGQVSVILSPSLYWIKKVELPVKSVREAMPLLPSLFEDQLDNTDLYSFFAYKEADYFYIFAYNDNDIIKLLEEKSISLSQVQNIYFAQSEFSQIEKPLKISKKSALVVKDGIVTKVPLNWVDEAQELHLEQHQLSKRAIRLKQYGKAPYDKYLYILAAFLMVFALLLATNYYILQKNLEKIESKESRLFTKYSLKPTMFQNRALLEKYKKIDKEQKALREAMATILKATLQQKERLLSLQYKNKKLTAQFIHLGSRSKEMIIQKLKQQGFSVSVKNKQDNLYIEITL
ncbi:MAG: hypothetical protein GXO30_07395 [Epsilonproteobacteria bacterium]|nr:hypothetical protein [Campylobacterota bacterium]